MIPTWIRVVSAVGYAIALVGLDTSRLVGACGVYVALFSYAALFYWMRKGPARMGDIIFSVISIMSSDLYPILALYYARMYLMNGADAHRIATVVFSFPTSVWISRKAVVESHRELAMKIREAREAEEKEKKARIEKESKKAE
jgi:hypothetical protein